MGQKYHQRSLEQQPALSESTEFFSGGGYCCHHKAIKSLRVGVISLRVIKVTTKGIHIDLLFLFQTYPL